MSEQQQALGRRLPAGLWRLGVLCLCIVAIGMIRPTMTPHTAGWVVLVCGLVTIAGAGAFFLVTRRVAHDLPLVSGSMRVADAILLVLRRTGLPFLGLGFFLFWTFVYVGLWWYRPEGTFTGLAENPRFSDFFYYSVSTAFIAPPQDIVATSRGARSATMIEMLTGLALLTTYVSTLFDLWRGPPADRARVEEPPERTATERE